jgi:Peptidase family M23
MHLRRLTRLLVHASGLLAAAGMLAAAGLVAAVPAAAATGPAAGWGWPLRPRPPVAAPFDAPAGLYAPGHRGVDLVTPAGSLVLAAAGGTVAFAGRVAGRGVVSVDHPGGLRTTYEPVAARVTRGDRVGPAGVLGVLEAGPSHCPGQPCLHWGVRRGETYLDPLALLGATRVRLLPVWGVADLPVGNRAPAGRETGRSPPAERPGGVGATGGASWASGAAAALAVGAGGLALAGAAVQLRRQSSEGRSAASRR